MNEVPHHRVPIRVAQNAARHAEHRRQEILDILVDEVDIDIHAPGRDSGGRRVVIGMPDVRREVVLQRAEFRQIAAAHDVQAGAKAALESARS